MSAIFGGSKQSSQSSNQAYPYLKDALSGVVKTGTGALDFVGSLLGLNGSKAGTDAFDNYRNSTGYNFTLDQGSQAITNNAAAKGLLGSGATAKALQSYGQNTANSFFQQYLNNLFQSSGQGLQGAGIIGGAGGTSSSKGSSKNGLGGFLGGLL